MGSESEREVLWELEKGVLEKDIFFLFPKGDGKFFNNVDERSEVHWVTNSSQL